MMLKLLGILLYLASVLKNDLFCGLVFVGVSEIKIEYDENHYFYESFTGSI